MRKADSKLLLIINPNAGNGRVLDAEAEVQEIFNNAGYRVERRYTEGLKHATQLSAEEGANYDLLVCCGGDGTLSEVANGLMAIPQENRPDLGYLPAGTTNDVARSLSISMNIKEAALDIINGKRQPFDIGQFNDRYFVYVASFGAFTATSYSTPQSLKNVLGHLAYILEGIKDLRSIKPYPLSIETDERQLNEEFIFGAVSNSRSIAGLLSLDEELVSFDDGLFEVLLVRPPSDARALMSIINALRTRNYSGPWVSLLQTRSIRFISEEALDWSLDGEHVAGGVKAR